MKAIADIGQADNTIVIFSADNGAKHMPMRGMRNTATGRPRRSVVSSATSTRAGTMSRS